MSQSSDPRPLPPVPDAEIEALFKGTLLPEGGSPMSSNPVRPETDTDTRPATPAAPAAPGTARPADPIAPDELDDLFGDDGEQSTGGVTPAAPAADPVLRKTRTWG